MTMQSVTPLLSRTSCAAGNGRFWNIHPTYPMSSCDYDLFAKVKEPLRWARYNTRDEHYLGPIRAIGRSIWNINKYGSTDGVRDFPNIWQKVINKGVTILKYINVVPLRIKPCQKYLTLPLLFIQLVGHLSGVGVTSCLSPSEHRFDPRSCQFPG